MADDKIRFGYWVVAFIDLLGQKTAFKKADRLPTNEAEERNFQEAVRASIGVIRNMRSLLEQFQREMTKATENSPLDTLSPEKRAVADQLRKRNVRYFRLSDGAMLACPLTPGADHQVPVAGVEDIFDTCITLMMLQLAMGHPIRGGLDIGIASEVDGELFGAALVKAYILESECAKYPRLLVGNDLVEFLRPLTTARVQPGNLIGAYQQKIAVRLFSFLAHDDDGKWIVDYAGESASRTITASGNLLPDSLSFARKSRDAFQLQRDEGTILFERYTRLVGYLEQRERFWPPPSKLAEV